MRARDARFVILSALVLSALVLSGGCTSAVGNIDRVTGSGDISTESRSLQRVSEVVLRSIGDGEVVFGTKQSIVIEAEDNLLPLITTEVRGGTPYIGVEEGTSISPTRAIHYLITVGPVDRAEISGVGSLTIRNPSSDQLELSVPGAGAITAVGTVDMLRASVSGAGDIDASALAATDVSVEVSGTGNAIVWASGTLEATVSGVGSVSYWGDPSLDETITGLGDVRQLGVR